MTRAGIEARFKSPRGVIFLWLVATVSAAVVALLMWHGGVPGWDDAAHVYKVYLLRHGQSIFWDNYWYGGGYGAVNYGFVFYVLALFVPAKVIAVLAAGALPPLYYLYQRDMWKIDDVWPSWLLVGVMAFYLSNGQDPFVLGLALTMGGLVLVARGRPVLAALPVAVGIFANPLAFVIAGIFMLGDFAARRELRRRYLVFFLACAPFIVARLFLGAVFSEPGAYLNQTTQLLLFLGFGLAGIGVAGVNADHPRRPFLILFAVYAVVCVVSFVTPGSPLGNNVGRFFMVFGLPLLYLLRHSTLRRPYPTGDLAMVVVVLFAILQFSTSYSHFTRTNEWPQTHASFFAPALKVAAQHYDPNYRIHVVALRRHWEAAYFPEAGLCHHAGLVPSGRRHPQRFLLPELQRGEYVAWLKRMGVQYVFLPQRPAGRVERHEATMLKPRRRSRTWSSRESGACTARKPAPLVVGPHHGSGRAPQHVGHQRSRGVDRPGDYLVKVSWSPYWVLSGGPGSLSLGPDRFIVLKAGAAGAYTVRFRVTPPRLFRWPKAASGSELAAAGRGIQSRHVAHTSAARGLRPARRAHAGGLLLGRLLQLLQGRAGGQNLNPRVTMQIFQKQERAILGGMDEALAMLKVCAGRYVGEGAARRWEEGWDKLEVLALYDGDEVSAWETVMLIEGDYSLFAHLETVYLGALTRRTLISTNVRRVVEAAGEQADPLLSGALRPLPGADRRRLRRSGGRCHRREH